MTGLQRENFSQAFLLLAETKKFLLDDINWYLPPDIIWFLITDRVLKNGAKELKKQYHVIFCKFYIFQYWSCHFH